MTQTSFNISSGFRPNGCTVCLVEDSQTFGPNRPQCSREYTPIALQASVKESVAQRVFTFF